MSSGTGEGREEGRGRPRRRRGLRRLAFTGLALATAAVLLVAFGLFPQEPARAWLEDRLRQATGPGSGIGTLRLWPGRLRGEIGSLVLEGPTYRLEVPRARVDLALAALTGGPLEIRFLELEEPRLLLKTSAGAQAPSEPWAGPLLVHDLRIRGGTIDYDLGSGHGLRVEGLDTEGALGSGALDLRAAGLEWRRPGNPLRGKAVARLALSPALGLRLESLRFDTGTSRLEARGDLGRVGAFRPALDLVSTLDLGEMGRLADRDDLSGTVRGTGRLATLPEATDLTVALDGRGLALAGWPLDSASAEVAWRFPGGGDARLTASLLGGSAEGSASVEGEKARGRLALTRLDVAALRRRLALDLPAQGTASATVSFSGPTAGPLLVDARLEATGTAGSEAPVPVRSSLDLGGRVWAGESRTDLDWDLDLEAGPADGVVRTFRLQGHGRAAGTGPPSVEGVLEGEVEVATAEGVAAATLAGEVAARGEAWQARAALRSSLGSLDADAESRSGVLRRLGLRGDGLRLEPWAEGLRGQARFSFQGSGKPGRLDGRGEAHLAGLGWREAELGPLHAGLAARGGELVADLEAPELKATALVRVSLAGGPDGRLHADLALDGTPLAAVAPLLPAGPPLAGSASARASVSAPLARPTEAEARGRVAALDLSRGRLAARADRPFDLAWRGGRLTLSGLSLSGEGLSLQAEGSAGPEPGSPLDLRARGRLDLTRLEPLAGWAISGTAEGDLVLTGTWRRPRAEGGLSTSGVRAEAPRLPAVVLEETRVLLAGDAVEVPGARATAAGGTLELSGRVPFAAILPGLRLRPGAVDPAEAASLRLAWSGLDANALLEAWQGPAPSREAALSGALAGEASLRGGLSSLEEAEGAARLPATPLGVGERRFLLSPVEARLAGGRAHLEPFTVTTEGGTLRGAGQADLVGRSVSGTAEGDVELGVLSPFLEDTALAGNAEVKLAVEGPLDSPRPRGSLLVREGTVRLRDIPQALTSLDAALLFEGDRLDVAYARALLGGGEVTAGGGARIAGGSFQDVAVEITGREMALRYPEGLKTRIDADLALAGRTGALRLGGTVRAERGLYDQAVALEESLLSAVPPPSRSPLLRSIGLDIQIDTTGPVLVRNDLAQLQAAARIRLLGDLAEPAPFGRAEITPGGRLFLQEREFTVDRGTLVYRGTWDPVVDLSARAQVETDYLRYDVTVQAEGPLAALRLTFQSQPALPEAQVLSLLVTGRTTDEALASGAWVVGEQAAALLTGRLSRGLTQGLRGLGLDQVSIQPELLAREEQPGARFTFGKRLTPRLSLVYSLSLRDPEERFVQVEARPGFDVTLTGQRRDDGTLGAGAGQRFRFGGPARAGEAEERTRPVVAVRLEGDLGLPEDALRQALRTRPGRRVGDWDLQDDADRLRERLRESGHVEAEVGASLVAVPSPVPVPEGSAGPSAAVFRVRAGPRYAWRVVGLPSPPDLTNEVRKALYEEEALERGRRRLRRELDSRGLLEGRVAARVLREGERRTLLFEVEPGPGLSLAGVDFPGATVLSPGRLLKAAGGASRLLEEPERALESVREAYRARHHLAAEAGPVARRREGRSLRLVVPVREGPRARLVGLSFPGATLPADALARVAALETPAPYDEEAVLAAQARLQDLYLASGYPAARVRPQVVPSSTDLEVAFQVTEGERVVVEAIEVTGLSRTRESLVRRELALRPGQLLDPRKLADTERRLLALGVFSRVSATFSPGSRSTVTVAVEEDDRLRAGYELRYGEEDGLSGRLDGEVRNLLGRGLVLGLSRRQGADVRETRGSIHQPSLFRRGDLTATVFELDEDLPFTEEEDIHRVQRGFELQQKLDLGRRWNLLYGYRLKRSLTTASVILYPTPKYVSGLDVSLLRDTRDNPLDPRRGRFFSANLELSPRALKSDFDFVKGYAQLFLARTFGPWTWAQGYRLGLAHVFSDEPLVSDEGFEAGGANTVRGVGRNEAGGGGFVGAQAVLVLNQELRWRHRTGLGAAVFYDAGRAFPLVRDLGLDLRHSLGAGLRWESPVGLLRLDVGFPLDREEGEKPRQIWFGVGQAF